MDFVISAFRVLYPPVMMIIGIYEFILGSNNIMAGSFLLAGSILIAAEKIKNK